MKTSPIISAAAGVMIAAAGFALSAQAQDQTPPASAAQPAQTPPAATPDAPKPDAAAQPSAAGQAAPALTPEETAKAEDMLNMRCTACHGADLITSLHNDKSTWEGIMEQMGPNAGLNAAESALLLKYLVAHHGP